MASAYDLLTAVNDGKADASVAPKVAALLIRAAEKRTSKDKISASGSGLMIWHPFLAAFSFVSLKMFVCV